MPAEDRVDAYAERGVLAGVARHGVDAFVDADDLVTERSFAVDNNGLWYRCLRHGFGQDPEWRPDLASVLAHARTLGLGDTLDTPDEVKYFRSLLNMPAELPNVRKLAAKVRRLEVARVAYEVAGQIEAGLDGVTGDEAGSAILSLLEKPVFDFAARVRGLDQDKAVRLGDGLELWVEHLAANPVEQIGLPSGFRRADRAIGGGLRKGAITMWGARPNQGKTQALMNVSLSLACGSEYQWPRMDVVPRVPVLYLDTEMGEEDHRARNLANLSGVDVTLIETGKFGRDPAAARKVREAVARLADVPYHFRSIAGEPFEDTLAFMRRWVQKEVGLGPDGKAKDCAIAYDYVKLMDASGLSKAVQEHQLIGFIMSGLHNFAARYGVPMVAACQLNRDGINSEETSAVGGSDRILHYVSNLFLHKPLSPEEIADQHQPGPKYDFKEVLVKKRHGAGLGYDNFIYMKTDFRIGRITEGPTKKELQEADPHAGLKTDGVGDIAFGD